MASNVSGIAITIRAFLPTGKTLDEQFEALSLVKAAHASGDYSALLSAAKIDEVKTEQKVRRVEDQPATLADLARVTGADQPNEILDELTFKATDEPYHYTPDIDREQFERMTADAPAPDADVPKFLKPKRTAA